MKYTTAWIIVWKVVQLAKATNGVTSLTFEHARITSNVGVL